MKIYIDADACPVKEEIVRVGERHGLEMIFVSNQYGRRPDRNPLIKSVIVQEGPDVADDWIAERIEAGDVCVTQDIPLAKRCLETGGHAIGPTGKEFDEENIGMALAVREIRQHLRETGEGGNYNAPFSKADRSRFLQTLEKIIQEAKQG